MEKSEDWLVIESSSGYSKDGIPVGKILCRYPEDVKQIMKDHNIENVIITPYVENKWEIKGKLVFEATVIDNNSIEEEMKKMPKFKTFDELEKEKNL